MAGVERPDYVKDEHIDFLNRTITPSESAYYWPFQDQVAHNFSIPIEVARQIVNYWFQTLDDDEE